MVENLEGEEWVVLVLENRKGNKQYAISNFGRVASFTKDFSDAKTLPMKNEPGRYTRLRIEFIDGVKSVYVHQVVAQNFLEMPKKKNLTDILHINGNINDNHFENLQWVSHASLLKTKAKKRRKNKKQQSREKKGNNR